MRAIRSYSAQLDEYSERRFKIMADGSPLFYIGFSRRDLLAREVYITLEPLGGLSLLRVSEWKRLKELFDKYVGYTYHCQVPVANRREQKFAEFFGFKEIERVIGQVLYMRDMK